MRKTQAKELEFLVENVGKTFVAFTICPSCFPPGHPANGEQWVKFDEHFLNDDIGVPHGIRIDAFVKALYTPGTPPSVVRHQFARTLLEHGYVELAMLAAEMARWMDTHETKSQPAGDT